jgi:hypothetical protein
MSARLNDISYSGFEKTAVPPQIPRALTSPRQCGATLLVERANRFGRLLSGVLSPLAEHDCIVGHGDGIMHESN